MNKIEKKEEVYKVTFSFSEEVWFTHTIEIPVSDLRFETNENFNFADVKNEIGDFIFSNYSAKELIKLGARPNGHTEVIVELAERCLR